MIERILLVPVMLSALGCGTMLFDPTGQSGPARVIAREPVVAGEPIAAVEPVVVRRSPDGLFRVPATINGTAVRLIVDTGATLSVIGPATLARIDDADGSSKTTGKLLTFSGEVPYRVVGVKRLDIANKAIDDAELAVIDQPGTPDVIGQDLIRLLGKVSIEEDRLTIG